MPTLLEQLQARTIVDCDTLSALAAALHGPFADCTSNQAIACIELQQDLHKDLLSSSAKIAKECSVSHPDIPLTSLAVEISMIQLALRIAPNLSGNIHIQANPFDAYSTERTVAGGERIVNLVKHLAPEFGPRRVCIKIPSTWEGFQACKILELKGIKTLATTLFTIEQAVLAGKVGCTYIAPYVNELKVHFDKYYHDDNPNFDLCVQAQKWYRSKNIRTKVLPASLTSIQECMALAGADHITIAPPLLDQLARITVRGDEELYPSRYDSSESVPLPTCQDWIEDESRFRIAVTRNNDGKEEAKLIQAINIFCDMQLTLEGLFKHMLGSNS